MSQHGLMKRFTILYNIARGFSIYICRIDINVIPKWRQKRTWFGWNKSKRPQNTRKICSTLLIHDINKGQFVLYRLAILFRSHRSPFQIGSILSLSLVFYMSMLNPCWDAQRVTHIVYRSHFYSMLHWRHPSIIRHCRRWRHLIPAKHYKPYSRITFIDTTAEQHQQHIAKEIEENILLL